MSWHFSRALVEEYLEATSSDGEPSAPLNMNPMPQAFCLPDRMTDVSRLSRFGMTFAPLTESHGEALLTSYLADFHAKTSVLPEEALASPESDQDSGQKWPGLLAKYDPATCSWKTAQCSLFEDSEPSLETWPRWGLMRNGACWVRPTLARLISGNASGFSPWPTPQTRGFTNDGDLMALGKMCDSWEEMSAMAYRASEKKKAVYWPTPCLPGNGGTNGKKKLADMLAWPTPTVCGNHNRKGASKTSGDGLATAVARTWPTATATAFKGWSPNHNRADTDDRLDYTVEREAYQSGQQTPPKRLNPAWVEWLMGWPLGWTDLKPLEMGKFQEWQQQHSVCSETDMGEAA